MTSARRAVPLATALGAAMVLAGCAASSVQAPVKPPPGFLFESYSAPVETNFEATPVGSRQGSSKIHFIQDPILTGLSFTWGDGSVTRSAASGGIQTIQLVDYHVVNVLGIYVQVEVKVSGD